MTLDDCTSSIESLSFSERLNADHPIGVCCCLMSCSISTVVQEGVEVSAAPFHCNTKLFKGNVLQVRTSNIAKLLLEPPRPKPRLTANQP